MFIVKLIFKLYLWLLFLALYGLSVFTGAILWKAEELNWPNFKRDFMVYSGEIVNFTKAKLAEQKQESNSASGEKPAPDDGVLEIVLDKKQDVATKTLVEPVSKLSALEGVFAKAQAQLKKAQPGKNNYQSELKKTRVSFEKVLPLAEDAMEDTSLSKREKARVEEILTESLKQIYWANKFGGA